MIYNVFFLHQHQPEPHNRSKKMALMMDEMEAIRERQKAAEEEQNIAELIGMLYFVKVCYTL